MEAVERKYVNTNIWTELLFPSLSRIHVLRARDETSRRATQLAFAVHLYKARQGRWPDSLDALFAAQAESADVETTPVTGGVSAGAARARMRTDPFTGKDFGYRLGPDGPMIYSFSENARDDGGVHSPRWDDKITNDADSDDFVFWPPQRRAPSK